MWPTTWHGADVEPIHVALGRFGNLDRVIGRRHRHHAMSHVDHSDPPRCPTGQVEDTSAMRALPVVDKHHDGPAGVMQRHLDSAAERNAGAGRGHSVLVEDHAAAGPASVVPRAIPRYDAAPVAACSVRSGQGQAKTAEAITLGNSILMDGFIRNSWDARTSNLPDKVVVRMNDQAKTWIEG